MKWMSFHGNNTIPFFMTYLTYISFIFNISVLGSFGGLFELMSLNELIMIIEIMMTNYYNFRQIMALDHLPESIILVNI